MAGRTSTVKSRKVAEKQAPPVVVPPRTVEPVPAPVRTPRTTKARLTPPTAARTTTKSTPRPEVVASDAEPYTGAPRTTEERLRRIEEIAERINGYIRFMCQIGTFASSSAEAKDKAVTDFHDRLALAANQLGRVHDELWLG